MQTPQTTARGTASVERRRASQRRIIVAGDRASSSHAAFSMDHNIKLRAKPALRISSPPGSHSSLGARDDEKPRRAASRTLGVANRVWLIVLGVLVTILLLHRLLPGPSKSPLPSYASGDLHPKNYFNASSSTSPPPNPFAFCPSNGPSDELAARYGASPLSQTRRFQGTGYRIQRVLRRALSGQPVTISVIGGSSASSSQSLVQTYSDCALQYLHATAQAITQSLPNAMCQSSSTGGTPSSHIPRRKSQTVLCGGRVPTTSVFAVRIIFRTLQTLSLLSLILMIHRTSFHRSALDSACRHISISRATITAS